MLEQRKERPKNIENQKKIIKEPEPLPRHLLLGVDVGQKKDKDLNEEKIEAKLENQNQISNEEKIVEPILQQEEIKDDMEFNNLNNLINQPFEIKENNEIINIYPKYEIIENNEIQYPIYEPIINNYEFNYLNNLINAPIEHPYIDLTTTMIEAPQLNFVSENEYKFGNIEESYFYNLLMKYKKASIKFEEDKFEIDQLEKECVSLAEKVWVLESKLIKLTKKCGDGSELSNSYEYQYYKYEKENAKKLEMGLISFKEKRMTLMNLSIHNFQSSKLNIENFI